MPIVTETPVSHIVPHLAEGAGKGLSPGKEAQEGPSPSPQLLAGGWGSLCVQFTSATMKLVRLAGRRLWENPLCYSGLRRELLEEHQESWQIPGDPRAV